MSDGLSARTGIDERTQRLIRTITGLDPLLVEDFDIRNIDPRDRAQVRVDKNVAPKERVQAMVWMMDAGDVFPALFMTQDGVIGDGNTRIMSYKERGDFFVRSWVLPVDYKTADPEMQARISYVGECLNAQNGLPPTKDEQFSQVRHGIRIGLGDKQISVEAGINPTVVKNMRARVNAEVRLERLSVTHTRTDAKGTEKPLIAEAALAKLGKAAKLEDETFVAVAELARDAGFNAGETQNVISKIREQPASSPVDVVTRERDANKQRIADREQGKNGQPPKSRQLKRNLGLILNNTAGVLVEHNADLVEDHLDAVERAIGVLTEVADLQRKVNADLLAGAKS